MNEVNKIKKDRTIFMYFYDVQQHTKKVKVKGDLRIVEKHTTKFIHCELLPMRDSVERNYMDQLNITLQA